MLLVDDITNHASLLLWQSRRQTLTALSAPEAEVVALSEALTPSVVIHEVCHDIGLEVGVNPEILFDDSQVTLTKLRNESVTTRSRPFANRFNYAGDMCHVTTLHLAAVKAVFEAGKSQTADGLTKGLNGASMNDICVRPGSGSSHSLVVLLSCPSQATILVSVGSDLPKGEGGTLDPVTLKVRGAPGGSLAQDHVPQRRK